MLKTTMFFVVFGVLLILAEGQELVLKPSQESHTKAEGTSIFFSCQVINYNDTVDIKWYDDKGKEITDRTGRLYIEEDEVAKTMKLYITNIVTDDAGKYSCRTTIDGTLYSKDVNLELFRDISFKNAPSEQNPKIYEDAMIQCEVTGVPVPTVSWRYGGKRLRDGVQYAVNPSGLVIKNITESDNGLYICRAEVEADGRLEERNITVAVHIPPQITKELGDVKVVQGDSVTLTCEASGLPQPQFKFFKDGSRIPMENTTDVIISETEGSLTFTSTKKTDEASYTCRAHNRVGDDDTLGQLKILVKPSIVRFTDVVGLQGQSLSLSCLVAGDPHPKITIRKEGSSEVDEASDDEDEKYSISTGESGAHQLTINVLEIEDGGSYICSATSDVGSANKTANVVVQYKPKFTEKKKEVYNWAGKTRNLTCESLGEPTPTIEWRLYDTVLENNDTYHIYHSGKVSSLQVTVSGVDQAWIYGSYKCLAKNLHGEAEMEVRMMRASPPSAPEAVRVAEQLPTAIVFEVDPPKENGGVAVDGYKVQYREKVKPVVEADSDADDANETESRTTSSSITDDDNDDDDDDVLTFDNADTSIRVRNLKADTTYTFKVSAKNELGFGEPLELTATTDSYKKPHKLVITSLNISSGPLEYTIAWKEPDAGGLTINTYEISFKKVSLNKDTHAVEDIDKDWTEQTVSATIGMHDYTIRNLSPNTYYKLKIRAQNNIGWSEQTEFRFKTTEDPNAIPSTTEEESTTAAVVVMTTEGRESTGGEDSGEEHASSHQAGAGPGIVVGIVLGVFVLFLIVVDVSCYFINSCGVTSFLCMKVCKQSRSKEKSMEEGESDIIKQPLPDDENVAAELPDIEAKKQQECLAAADSEEHHDKKPLLDEKEPEEAEADLMQERLNQANVPEDKEDLKEPEKDDIPLKPPKAVDSEDVNLTEKTETTAAV